MPSGSVSCLLRVTVAAAEEPAHTLAGINPVVMPVVYVEDRGGLETTGKLLRAGDEGLVFLGADGERTIAADEIQRIWRRGDSVKNGFWIGAAIGAALTVLPVAMADNTSSATPAAAVLVDGAVFGLIGAGIDALHVGRTLIYTAPDARSKRVRVQPEVSRTRTAVRLSLTF